MDLTSIALPLFGLFNFDQYLTVFRVLFYQVLPAVLVILTIYTIWGIFSDIKEDFVEDRVPRTVVRPEPGETEEGEEE
jgi:hypothetical protein